LLEGEASYGHLQQTGTGDCCTVTIGERTSDILPREYGVFNAVILRLDEGDGYQIRVDEPGSKWNGWVMIAEPGVLGKDRRTNK
jgi:hypothetical protein